SVSLIIAIGIVIIYNSYFDSPKEALLKKENQELKLYYEILEKEMEGVNSMLLALQERDDNVYRVIFEAEAIPSTIRSAGFGGAHRYKNLLESGLAKEELILNNFQKLDKLKKQMYIQTKSYDEILEMAKDKSKMLKSIPDIRPIHTQELTLLLQLYGMRIHSIQKVRNSLLGLDSYAQSGSLINVLGDGTGISVTAKYVGYGKEVE